MPVQIREFLKVKALDNTEHIGEAIAANLVAIKVEDNSIAYGSAVERVKLLTKIVCDGGKDCAKLQSLDDFTTSPKIIEFEETASDMKFLQDIADVVILQDYKGDRVVFCSKECASGFLKRESRKDAKVLMMESGKGFRSSDPVVVETQAILENGK